MSRTNDDKEREGNIQVQATSQTTFAELDSTETKFIPQKRKAYPTTSNAASQPQKQLKCYQSISKQKRRAAVSKVIMLVFHG